MPHGRADWDVFFQPDHVLHHSDRRRATLHAHGKNNIRHRE